MKSIKNSCHTCMLSLMRKSVLENPEKMLFFYSCCDEIDMSRIWVRPSHSPTTLDGELPTFARYVLLAVS
jgi:hypothetical protein